jgi:hypothetical protein
VVESVHEMREPEAKPRRASTLVDRPAMRIRPSLARRRTTPARRARTGRAG